MNLRSCRRGVAQVRTRPTPLQRLMHDVSRYDWHYLIVAELRASVAVPHLQKRQVQACILGERPHEPTSLG